MAINPRAPASRFPKVPDKITIEDILPSIRTIAHRPQHSYVYPGLDLKPGKKFLILADSTNDMMVIEALSRVIREGGAKLQTVMMEGYPGMTDSVDLLDTMFSRTWWPSWTWQAVAEADATIRCAFLLVEYTPEIDLTLKRKPSTTMYLTRDICLPQFQNFPLEVRIALDEKTWKSILYSQKIELSDLEGTDLKWTLTRERWDGAIARDIERGYERGYHPGHLMTPLPSKNAEGKLVTSSITFGGPVDRATLTIEGGQAVRVDGEGKFPDTLRQTFEQYREVRSQRLPGPGLNWWTTLAMGTSPKGRISSNFDKMTGSGRMHAWGAGHSRSGVIHTSVGEGLVSKDHRIIRHVNLYFPTLICDGRTIIDKGHLTTLDDPEIIKLTEKYGDPRTLLREDWIPAVPGVNVA